MAEGLRSRLSTVRVRVTVAAAVVLVIVLVALSLLLVTLQRSALVEQLDDTLSAEAERVATGMEATGIAPGQGDDDLRVIVVDDEGVVLTASADDEDLAPLLDAGVEEGEVTLDDDRFRVVSERYDGPNGAGRVIVAGARDDVDESIDDLTTSLLWVIPPAVLVLIVVVWLIVGRTLRPVERIRSEVASIDVGELERRVPVPSGDDEVARLAVTMNDMLGRLQSSVRRQQRFVADASHELRTPLTRMRTELEVDERDPARADPQATRRSQLDEISALQQMIEDLLLLARSDAADRSKGPTGSEAVDLDDIVFDEARAAGTSSIPIETNDVSGAQVVGSRHELHRVVRNLLDNARRHARSCVVVELTERDGDAWLVVSDDGPGIPPEHRTRVLERFTRLDESRSGGAGRSGLGLAIVDDIVRRHGGTTTIDDAPGGGARVTVRLPTTPPPS